MHDDRRKAAARGAASRVHNLGEARGKGYREGDIGARVKADRKARRGEKIRRVGVVWVQLLARAYIYSSYI